MKKEILYILTFWILLGSMACGRRDAEKRLDAINALSAHAPDSALRALEKINIDSLRDNEKYFRDLLIIKSKDKAYIRHTSDSMIKGVIAYYEKHDKDGRYAEALYYGGRVNSDMGDYPTALRYFQDALDQLPETTKYNELRGNVLSQTGRLLNKLRLYDEAIPYLEEVIEIEKAEKDTVNLVYDYQLLGAILIHAERYKEASELFRKTLQMNIKKDLKLKSLVYLSAIQFETQNYDSALLLIRKIPEQLKDTKKYHALSYACKIYYMKGILDTAYYYAHQLAHATNSVNIKTGYEILLSPEIYDRLPHDSIQLYYKKYAQLTQEFVNQNNNEQALIQNSMFNYTTHERARLKAEESKTSLRNWTILILSILLIILIILIIRIHINKRIINKLRIEIDTLSILNHKLKINNNNVIQERAQDVTPKHCLENTDKDLIRSKHKNVDKNGLNIRNIDVSLNAEKKELKQKLAAELYQLSIKTKNIPPLPLSILNSRTYKHICQMIKEEKIIPFESPLWNRLEQIILNAYPDFKDNLHLLMGKNMSPIYYQMCLLMKCRFKAIEIAKLSARGKSSISSRRTTLKNKLVEYDLKDIPFDKLIQLL